MGISITMVDIRTSLNVRLTNPLFHLRAKSFFTDWLKQNLNTEDEDKLQFLNQEIRGWEQEYDVSLSISIEE